MEQVNKKQKPSSDDYSRVTHAAGVLASQACSVSALHIEDGMLQIQFNREVAYYARGIVREVAEGRKSAEWGLKELRQDLTALAAKSSEIGRKSVGVVAGVAQVVGGGAMCVGSYMVACPIGVAMAAHGTNNIIENGVNLWNGDSEMQGPVRKIYQSFGNRLGGSQSAGDKAYAIMDLGFSGWGLLRKIPKTGSWKLYRTIPTDFVRAYRQTSKPALTLEFLSDAITLEQLFKMSD